MKHFSNVIKSIMLICMLLPIILFSDCRGKDIKPPPPPSPNDRKVTVLLGSGANQNYQNCGFNAATTAYNVVTNIRYYDEPNNRFVKWGDSQYFQHFPNQNSSFEIKVPPSGYYTIEFKVIESFCKSCCAPPCSANTNGKPTYTSIYQGNSTYSVYDIEFSEKQCDCCF